MSQNQPGLAEAATRLIEQLMTDVLRQLPGATRADLALVAAAVEPPHCDLVSAVTVQGHVTARHPRNQLPLTDKTLLPLLLAGECALHRLRRPGPATSSGRLLAALVCPATDTAGTLHGALSIEWDTEEQSAASIARPHQAAIKRVATQIAEVLYLCGHQTFQNHIDAIACVIEQASPPASMALLDGCWATPHLPQSAAPRRAAR